MFLSRCCSPASRSRAQLSGDDAAKTARLASLLSRVLEDSEDSALSEAASHTLGHLVRSGGAMTSDIVEKEVRSGGTREARGRVERQAGAAGREVVVESFKKHFRLSITQRRN